MIWSKFHRFVFREIHLAGLNCHGLFHLHKVMPIFRISLVAVYQVLFVSHPLLHDEIKISSIRNHDAQHHSMPIHNLCPTV